MWDLPGPGLKPVSPALAGRFLTTAPPGKPVWNFFACQVVVSFPQHQGSYSYIFGQILLSEFRSMLVIDLWSILEAPLSTLGEIVQFNAKLNLIFT